MQAEVARKDEDTTFIDMELIIFECSKDAGLVIIANSSHLNAWQIDFKNTLLDLQLLKKKKRKKKWYQAFTN